VPPSQSSPDSRPEIADRLSAAVGALSAGTIVSAYLFGSQAEARAHRESDVDVGVLLTWKLARAARFEERVRLAALLPGRLHVRDVDVVVLNDTPPHLSRRIVWDGIPVFCADDELDHAFRRDVMLRAADLQPFLSRMRRLKIEALAR
jgi:predicted nucleotidyltransferase